MPGAGSKRGAGSSSAGVVSSQQRLGPQSRANSRRSSIAFLPSSVLGCYSSGLQRPAL
jgi:hypothetical protein